MRFESGVSTSSHDKRIRRHALISLFVVGLSLREISQGGVQVTEREIWREIFWMRVYLTNEISLCEFRISFVAGEITERRQSGSIVGVQLQNFCESHLRSIFLPKLPLQAGVVEKRIHVGGCQRQRILDILVCRIEIA